MPRAKDRVVRALRNESERVYERAENNRYVRQARNSKIGRLVAQLRHPHVRERTEELFSREVLGSVLIAATTTRTIEASVAVAFGAVSPWRIPTWIAIWSTAVTLFIWWEHVGDKATDVAEKATDKADDVTDKADEVTDKAKEVADESSDTVKQAAEKADEVTTKADEETETAEEAADDLNEVTKEERKKAREEAETDLLDEDS